MEHLRYINSTKNIMKPFKLVRSDLSYWYVLHSNWATVTEGHYFLHYDASTRLWLFRNNWWSESWQKRGFPNWVTFVTKAKSANRMQYEGKNHMLKPLHNKHNSIHILFQLDWTGFNQISIEMKPEASAVSHPVYRKRWYTSFQPQVMIAAIDSRELVHIRKAPAPCIIYSLCARSSSMTPLPEK